MSLAIVILSGGLDSTVLAHLLVSEGHRVHLLSFDYGQRHVRELEYSQKCALRLGARHDIIDLRPVGKVLGGSALTDSSIAVPRSGYDEETMAVTVVPNRNAIFLSIAYGVAVAQNARLVATAVHAGEHFIYPDCRPEFIMRFEEMQRVAIEGCGDENLRLYAPFAERTKAEIVEIGARLKVPFGETWSCYEGLERHCGKCGTCIERREAFAAAQISDPTEYDL